MNLIPDDITPESILARDLGLYWRLAKKRLPANRQAAAIARLQHSHQQFLHRQQNLPQPDLKGRLPIHDHVDVIRSTITDHQIAIVCSDTGSGKTTQLPKICLSCGFGARGYIGHTQPRRIAARTVANRIAQELGSPLGSDVGYQVRFDDRHHEDGYVKLMTDGILLGEIQQNPLLRQYEVLIIDEAHERSLNIDFIFGHIKTNLGKRPDLKVIITSATINPEAFSAYFNEAPIIRIPGKTYPIEHVFESGESENTDDLSYVDRIMSRVEEILGSNEPGDILVFLPGEQQIREVSQCLHRHLGHRALLLPLYSRLSLQQQNRVFQPASAPKVVLATNVAETSLTVPGIKYVIDSGLARISRYSVRSKIQRLPIEKVSQAAVLQRAGRCGRTAPGTCFHLYSKQDLDQRPEYTEPEVLRTNLAEVILLMSTSRLGRIEEFPFINPPEQKLINDGYRLLRDLHALDQNDQPTSTGRLMAQFPMDPRLGRILVESAQRQCSREIITIVSALSVGDPRLYPRDQQAAAEFAHRSYAHEKSDFMVYLNLWDDLHAREAELSRNKFKRSLEKSFISYLRWSEWKALRASLIRIANEMRWSLHKGNADYAAIHISLLTGLVDLVGNFDKEHKQYKGLRNRVFIPHPQSSLRNRNEPWIITSGLTETSRVFAHLCAGIEAEWVRKVAGHLVKYEYSQPYWDARSGFVRSTESASLHGLILHANKKISFEHIDIAMARNVFIREALVGNDLGVQADFIQHNRSLLETLSDYAARLRLPHLEPDTEQLFAHFDQIVPADICNRQKFLQWVQHEKSDRALHYPEHAVFYSINRQQIDREYPGTIQIGNTQLPIRYRFEPQHAEDGFSYLIDLPILEHIEKDFTEWTISPWVHEKVSLILRALPKSARKVLTPIDSTAQAFLASNRAYEIGFYQSLCQFLYTHYTLKFSPRMLQQTELPSYLKPHYILLDKNEELGKSDDFEALQLKYCTSARRQQITGLNDRRHEQQYTSWTLGTLSTKTAARKGQHSVTLYPALVDLGDSVTLRCFSKQEEADRHHLDGVIRLIQLHQKDSIKFIQKKVINKSPLPLLYAGFDTDANLPEEFFHYLVRTVFIHSYALPRDEMDFTSMVEQYRSEFFPTAEHTCTLLTQALEQLSTAKKKIKQAKRYLSPDSIQDMNSQLEYLLYPGFLFDIEQTQLNKLNHYLQALQLRIDKAQQRPDMDSTRCEQIKPLWDSYCQLDNWCIEHTVHAVEIPALHWLLEEYRVHLFAQELQKEKVSQKRIQQQLERANREKLLYDN